MLPISPTTCLLYQSSSAKRRETRATSLSCLLTSDSGQRSRIPSKSSVIPEYEDPSLAGKLEGMSREVLHIVGTHGCLLFFFKPHPTGPAKGSKQVCVVHFSTRGKLHQTDLFLPRLAMGRSPSEGTRAGKAKPADQGSPMLGGVHGDKNGGLGGGRARRPALLGTHLVSVHGAKGSPFTAPSQTPSLQQSGQCVSSWPSDPAEFTAVGGFQT